MKLIIPLAGDSNEFSQYFNTKKEFIFFEKKFFLQKILDQYDSLFIKEIIIICKFEDDKRYNYIKQFKTKFSKLNYLFIKNKTSNQIETLEQLNNCLKNSDQLMILNPDSSFKIDKSQFKKTIKKNISGIIFYVENDQKILSITNKEKILKHKKQVLKVYPNNYNKFKNINNINITAGLYYIKKWELVKDIYLNKKVIKNKNTTCIHYYDYLLKRREGISCLPVKNFIDLGTVSKVREYFFWKKYFKKEQTVYKKNLFQNITNIIPAAGLGSRHIKLGYEEPKPLIKVSNKYMIEKSYESLPSEGKTIFIFNSKVSQKYKLDNKFFSNVKNLKIINIKNKTKGMAITISRANKFIEDDNPVIVSSCDFKCLINYKKLNELIKNDKPDGIIFTWRNYPFASESPYSHAYVKVKNNKITKISEKIPISDDPDNDFAVTGMFYFKSAKIMKNCTKNMIKNNITVNGEYYTATSMIKLIEENKKVMNFEVDQFISWSLPEHLKSYNTWEKLIKNEKN